jgi:hypothetical protein
MHITPVTEVAFAKSLTVLAEKLYTEALWDLLCDDPLANELPEAALEARARELALERAREQIAQANEEPNPDRVP